mgnify:CR=1 FL=1
MWRRIEDTVTARGRLVQAEGFGNIALRAGGAEGVLRLKGFADVPGKPLTLTLYGQTHAVYMRHHDAPAFDARPIAGLANPPADWPHYITLKLITRTA